MSETKAWCAFYKTNAILDTVAPTAKAVFEKMTKEQKASYYAHYEGGQGIEIKKIMIRQVSFFNAERKRR